MNKEEILKVLENYEPHKLQKMLFESKERILFGQFKPSWHWYWPQSMQNVRVDLINVLKNIIRSKDNE